MPFHPYPHTPISECTVLPDDPLTLIVEPENGLNPAPIIPDDREFHLLATLLSHINDDGSPIAANILQRVLPNDLLFENLAALFAAIKEFHADGKFVDCRSLKEYARMWSMPCDEQTIARVFNTEPITNHRLLNHTIKEIVEHAAMFNAMMALRTAESHVQSADEFGLLEAREVVEKIHSVGRKLSTLLRRANAPTASRTLKDELDNVIAELKQTHGKKFIGLPTTTLPTLDKYLLGVRGFILLAAAPGAGKTSLGLQIGIDIVENNAEAVFIFFSFEMSRQDMYRRLISMTSGLAWDTLMLGSMPRIKSFNSTDGLVFSPEDRVAFNQAVKTLKGMGVRVVILDGETMNVADHDAMLAEISSAKKKTGASLAFVLVDNLQTLPFERPDGTPWSNDVERDNHVIGQILKLQRTTGDALMLISEQNKEGLGKDVLKSTRGTARGVYSPDCVMVLKSENTFYTEDEEARSAVILKIIKGRDGMFRGSIPLVFDYKQTLFTEDPDGGTYEVIHTPGQ